MKYKYPILIAAILFILAGTALVVRFIFGGPEDSWICVNDQWVKHGNPRNPAPQSGCRANTPKTNAQNPRPGEFSNGQLYSTFKTENFEIKYPNWPNIDKSKVAGADAIKVAVANAGCNFIIKETTVAPDTTLSAYVDQAINGAGSSIKMNKKEITGDRGYLDGDVTMSGVTMKNVSLEFKTGNNIYGIAFVAEKNNFSAACEPLVNEVSESAIVSK